MSSFKQLKDERVDMAVSSRMDVKGSDFRDR